MRVRWIGAALAAPLLLGLGLSEALRDTEPPRLFLEAPARAEAGAVVDVFVSANEPVRYVVRYAELEIDEVAQDLTVSLVAEPGAHEVLVTATDGAGNAAEAALQLVGVPVPSPRLEIPAAAMSGAPVAVGVSWTPADAEVRAVAIERGGEPLPAVRSEGRATAFVAAPLTTGGATIPIIARMVDAFDRTHEVTGTIAVLPDPTPIEELRIPASTLSVITPEGRQLEADTLEAAYADPLPALRWTETFVLPVDGVVTSGYGGPRRYVAGGPVSFHTGTDLRAPTGTPIRATNDGVVTVADFYPIKGGLVAIDHGGGVISLYFHQSKIHVRVGQTVARGDVIGESGATGLVTGPHLHWEMRVLGEPTDPMAWVGKLVPGP